MQLKLMRLRITITIPIVLCLLMSMHVNFASLVLSITFVLPRLVCHQVCSLATALLVC